MRYADCFRELTGHAPYPFQERIAERLLAGRSLVFRAPTGSGKTWSVVAPFLYAMEYEGMADRLIYALPLRSLATGIYGGVLEGMRRRAGARVEVSGKDRGYEGGKRYCSLQMGGQANDPYFESDLIFTTIDQVLSGYIGQPVSLPRRLGNIVAGSLVGSFLVFDEVHLLDAAAALGTTIEMLERLRRHAQFVLMTATLSDSSLKWLSDKLGAEWFDIPEAEIRALPAEREKRRIWRWMDGPLTADLVEGAHQGGRTIALVNRVGAAQSLYSDLSRRLENTGTALLLLHSRFYPEDRRKTEERLGEYFGPDASRRDVILVTTQVVEAGIDISADHLLTDLAPMNALIQRAGRVARYAGRNTGVVTVCDVDRKAPYADWDWDETRRTLTEMAADGERVDFGREREWIERDRGGVEKKALGAYRNLYQRRTDVNRAMCGEEGALSRLVRDIDAVSVVITDEPERLNFSGRDERGKRIGWPRLLSVPRTAVWGLKEAMRGAAGVWVAKGAEDDSEDQRPGMRVKWSVLDERRLWGQWLIAVHPAFARYDERTGLVLGEGGAARPIVYGEAAPIPRYQYEFEPWTVHAERVAAQARRMAGAHRWAARRLAGTELTPEQVERIVELACRLHDAGKLAEEWQAAAWRWQRDRDARRRAAGEVVAERPDTPVAHTDFDPWSERELARQKCYALPHHAVEGAYAVEEVVFDWLEAELGAERAYDAARAVLSAVARHHAPLAAEVGVFRVSEGAKRTLAAWLGARFGDCKECGSRGDAEDFSRVLLNWVREEDGACWGLFHAVVRRVRLADQASLK